MPREQINYPVVTGVLALLDDELPAGDVVGVTVDSDSPVAGEVVQECPATLHVNWHKDSHVQLALEGDLSYFRFAVEHPDGSTSDRSTVYTEPLTRDEVNKLIRVLRRARDQVYGRDE